MNLDGYIPVNERLLTALMQYPDLRVVEAGHHTEELGGEIVLVCKVAVYRTPDDQLPAIGTASEPVPGRTPYTKGSELMVGYTSALGRALGYMGIGIERALASSDEVKAAQQRRPAEPERASIGSRAQNSPQNRPQGAKPISPAQRDLITKMAAERGVEPVIPESFAEASDEITRLKGIPKP